MRRILALAAAMCLSISWSVTSGQEAASAPAPAPKDAQTDIPVHAVVLFSSGVGYFEHFGTVKGSGSTELHFKTQQINDILKSLILEDLDHGAISTITYPSQDPLAKTLHSFQVDISDNPPLGDLLNQLRGAKVKLIVAGEAVQGTILGLEKKQKPVGDKGFVEVWVLNLINGPSIRSIELDSILKLDLDDPQLQDELGKALAALSQARDQDKKPVTVNFVGQGERRVRIGYVVETPIWKTSYRLILSSDANVKPQIQGWAIVENQTDNDWNNVQLSLVSGRPISFIEDLYQPLYVPRPIVEPELYASLRPQTYEGGMTAQAAAPMAFGEAKGRAMLRAGVNRMKEADAEELAAAAGADEAEPNGINAYGFRRAFNPTASIASLASASKVGELFEYTVHDPISLQRQRSAMIPIITDAIEAEQLSIYNPDVLPRNPLNGARLKNTTSKPLPGGPITVFAGENVTYAGDANIDTLPPGQERLISYGVDLQVLVDSTKNNQSSQITSGRIVKGVLFLKRRNLITRDYVAENKGDKDKTLIIEHPLQRGWSLVDTEKPIETTESLYRFRGTVPAGKTTKLTVKEELVSDETVAILPADLGQVDFYSKTGEIPLKVRDVLAKAVGMKSALVDTQRKIDTQNQQIQRITQEQGRIRENMKTVAQNTDYYNRLLAKLNDQETAIEACQKEIQSLQTTLDQQRKDLEDYLLNTTIE